MAKWEENKHPRDDDGKFTDKGQGTPAERKRLRDLGIDSQSLTEQNKLKIGETNKYKDNASENKKQKIQSLIQTLQKIRKIKMKELVSFIQKLGPIELHTNSKDILAEFDKYSGLKNIYTRGNSDEVGFNFKIENIKDLPNFIKGSKFLRSKAEEGKPSRQHKGVKEWHYFVNNLITEKGNFNVIVNIRDKGTNQYVYEVAFTKKKT